MPELIAFRNSAAKDIAQNMKYQKHWKDVEEFKKEHLERLKPAVRIQPRLIFCVVLIYRNVRSKHTAKNFSRSTTVLPLRQWLSQ